MEKEIYLKNALYEETHWWFVGRRKIIKRVLDRIPFTPNPKVLEIGCGTGGNLPLLSRYGEVYGVELDAFARDYAQARQIGTILPGSLPNNLPVQHQPFDLIVMLDVLEHVDDDQRSLMQLSRLQQPGGYLLITVPAFQALWSEHDELHHHKRRYTKETLRPLVREAGYDIIFSSYFNSILFAPIVLLRLLKRFSKIKDGDDLSLPAKYVNKLLLKLFASEAYFINSISFPFGISLIILAKKAR